MDQRESIESTIIKSERVNKPHDSKPTMDMQCNAILDILTECSTYDKLAILRDRAYILSDMLSTIKDGVSQ